MNHTLSLRLGLESFESRDVASVSPLRPVGNLVSLADAPRPALVAESPSQTPPAGRISGIVSDPSDSAGIVFVGGWGSSMYQYAYNDPA